MLLHAVAWLMIDVSMEIESVATFDRRERSCSWASRRPVTCSRLLCRDVDVLDAALGWQNRCAIFAHAIKMKLNGFTHLRFDFFDGGARSDATWKIRNVRREIAFCLLDYDCIAHRPLISLIQTASGNCLAYRVPGVRRFTGHGHSTRLHQMLKLSVATLCCD